MGDSFLLFYYFLQKKNYECYRKDKKVNNGWKNGYSIFDIVLLSSDMILITCLEIQKGKPNNIYICKWSYTKTDQIQQFSVLS